MTAIRGISQRPAGTGKPPRNQCAQTDFTVPQTTAQTTVLRPPTTLSPMQRIGPFLIIDHLGSGGYGQIYRGELLNGAEYALKVVDSADQVASGFLRHELRMSRGVSPHPNVVQYHGIGRYKGLECLATDLIEGENLLDLIESRGKIDLPEALSLFRNICYGLKHIHDAGIVHRDMKPGNVMVRFGSNGEVVILDFGIAVPFSQSQSRQLDRPLAQRTDLLGSPAYMSPEQWGGRQLDERSDIFSLGVTLIEMLTGANPFAKHNLQQVLWSICTEEPDEAIKDLHPDVRVFIQRMVAKNANDRFRNVGKILEVLDELGF
jgi:serine/threonine protein kinase